MRWEMILFIYAKRLIRPDTIIHCFHVVYDAVHILFILRYRFRRAALRSLIMVWSWGHQSNLTFNTFQLRKSTLGANSCPSANISSIRTSFWRKTGTARRCLDGNVDNHIIVKLWELKSTWSWWVQGRGLELKGVGIQKRLFIPGTLHIRWVYAAQMLPTPQVSKLDEKAVSVHSTNDNHYHKHHNAQHCDA